MTQPAETQRQAALLMSSFCSLVGVFCGTVLNGSEAVAECGVENEWYVSAVAWLHRFSALSVPGRGWGSLARIR